MGPTEAKKVALVTQALSAILLLGAVSVVVTGGVGASVRPHEAVEVDPEEFAPTEETDEEGLDDMPPPDYEGIAMRLGMVENAPKPAEPVVTKDPEETPEETPAPATGVEVAYLGPVAVGSRKGALLRVDERQRMVFEGARVPTGDAEMMLVRVDDDEILVRDESSGRRRIELEARTSGAVTSAAPASGSPFFTNPGARTSAAQTDREQARANFRQNEPEDRRADYQRRRREAIERALEEGRIDQEDAERMLDRLDAAAESQREADGVD